VLDRRAADTILRRLAGALIENGDDAAADVVVKAYRELGKLPTRHTPELVDLEAERAKRGRGE
jgi:hypothetical protein